MPTQHTDRRGFNPVCEKNQLYRDRRLAASHWLSEGENKTEWSPLYWGSKAQLQIAHQRNTNTSQGYVCVCVSSPDTSTSLNIFIINFGKLWKNDSKDDTVSCRRQ